MSDLEFAIDKLRKLEEDGRDFAFKLTNGFSDKLHVDIKQWASDVDGALTFMTKSMKKSATYEKSAPYGKLSDEVWHTVQILPIAVDGCAGEICTYEEEPYEKMGHLVDNKCYVDNEHMFDIMRHLNVVSERMSGSRCAAASSDLFLNEKKPYPLSIFVNDITTCYHSLLNEYDEIRKVKREKIGKCVVEEDTDKDIIDACAAWDETSEKFNRNKVYFAPEIYNPLKAICYGKKAEFTLGDAPGHRTHLDLDKGVVDYYHDDEKSSETMHKLFTDVGLKCKIRYDGVSCTGLDRNNIKKVTKRLAGATGMDLRVAKTKYQREHWRTALEKIPGMGKRCRITTAEFDPVGVETCLIEEKIKAKE